MTNWYDSIVSDVSESVINRISDEITTHNTDDTAHADLRALINSGLGRQDVIDILLEYGLIRSEETQGNIILTSDKDILSYYDHDTAVFSATVYDGNGDVVPSATVDFYVNDTLYDSAVTDATGVATVSYNSEGTGDLNIKARNVERSLLSEIYSIEDCIDYDALTSNNNKFTLTGSANINYSSNGLSMVGTANATSLYLYKGTLPSNYIVECDVVSYTVGAYSWSSEICVSHTTISNGINNDIIMTRFGTFTDANYGNAGFTYADVSRIDAPYHLKVEIDNGVATFYSDDVQKHKRSSGTADFGLKSYSNRGVIIKNMKIKPL